MVSSRVMKCRSTFCSVQIGTAVGCCLLGISDSPLHSADLALEIGLFGAQDPYHLIAFKEDPESRPQPEAADDAVPSVLLPQCHVEPRSLHAESRSMLSGSTGRSSQLRFCDELREMALLVDVDSELQDVTEVHVRFQRGEQPSSDLPSALRSTMPCLRKLVKPSEWEKVRSKAMRFTETHRQLPGPPEPGVVNEMSPLASAGITLNISFGFFWGALVESFRSTVLTCMVNSRVKTESNKSSIPLHVSFIIVYPASYSLIVYTDKESNRSMIFHFQSRSCEERSLLDPTIQSRVLKQMTLRLPGHSGWLVAEQAAFKRFSNENVQGKKVWLHMMGFRPERLLRPGPLSSDAGGLRFRARPSSVQ